MYVSVFKTSFVKSNFNFEEMLVPEKTTLFTEGDKNNFVYFIENGAFNIYKNNLLIGIIKTSEFVGITSCLCDRDIYTFSAKSKKESKILRLDKEEFKKQLEEKKEFSRYIMKVLCERIKFADLKTKSFLDKTYEKRLIFELINYAVYDGGIYKIMVNIDELKMLTGIPKKTISTLFKKIVNDGLLINKKNELFVNDLEILRKEL